VKIAQVLSIAALAWAAYLPAESIRVRIYQGPIASPALRHARLRQQGDQLLVGGLSLRLTNGGADFTTQAALEIGPGLYTGRFVARLSGAELRLVNVVEFERYLPGVLAGEISSSWPLEAAKAQAVAARSFARIQMGQSRSQAYDLDGTPLSQVFLGTVSNHPLFIEAAAKTRGQVLLWKGQPVIAYFHANSGGETERPGDVWPGSDRDYGYLRNVRTPWSEGAPNFRWATNIAVAELQAIFASQAKGASLRGVRVTNWSPSDRARAFELDYDDHPRTVDGNTFRLAVGALRLPSLRVKLSRQGDQLHFEGRGFGHGVGLCQWSALVMAQRGYGYREILRTFFPETTLSEPPASRAK